MLRRVFPGSCPAGCGACAHDCRHICQQGWALWSTSPALLGITPAGRTKMEYALGGNAVKSCSEAEECRQFEQRTDWGLVSTSAPECELHSRSVNWGMS